VKYNVTTVTKPGKVFNEQLDKENKDKTIHNNNIEQASFLHQCGAQRSFSQWQKKSSMEITCCAKFQLQIYCPYLISYCDIIRWK